MSEADQHPIAGPLVFTLWEQQVLAGCLVDAPFAKDATASALGFKNPLHALLIESIRKLTKNDEPVSVGTLSQHLSDEYGESSLWQSYPEALLNALQTQNGGYRQALANLLLANLLSAATSDTAQETSA